MSRPRFWIMLTLGLSVGIIYFILSLTGAGGPWMALLKGTAVAILASALFLHVPGRDGHALGWVMAFGALGDVLIEWRLEAGALAFAVGHVIAIRLYRRHALPLESWSRGWIAGLFVLSVVAAAWLAPPEGQLGMAFYTLFVAGMTAAALACRFPASLTGLGAVLFLISDLLIFARAGGQAPWAGLAVLVWPLYLAGQTLLTAGGAVGLSRR